jgi:predicted transposase/invertase (TIGR01784 family)
MSFSKYLDPKNDYAFKRIFGTEKNQDILVHFLNDMLSFSGKNQIQSVSFLKTAQDPEIAAKKQSLVDVLCKDETGRQYIVEMQVARTPGFEKRAQYYAAKAYSR